MAEQTPDKSSQPEIKHRRVYTPSVLQLEAVECGAAALAMVLGFHKRVVPLTTLRRECGVSRDGSKASNIVRAARRYGMEAKGFTKSIKKLYDIKPPFIIFWNFNHFVVCEGFAKDRVYLNDPAVGHRSVTLKEFNRGFTGIVLVLAPGPEFEPGGRLPSVVGSIQSRLAGSWKAIGFCFLTGFLLVIPGLAIPAFNQIYIDAVILQGRVDWLRPLLLAMGISAILTGILHFIQFRFLRRLKIKLSIQFSSTYVWHLLHLPASFYAQRFAGEIANRSQINSKLADLLSGRLATTAIDVTMMGCYAALMFYYDVMLTLIGIAFAILNGVVLKLIAQKRVETNMRVLTEYGKAQGVGMAGLQSIETIKAGGLESGFFATWAGYYAKAAGARQDLEMSNQWLGITPTLLTALTSAAILVFGGLRVMDGEISIGMLVAFQSLMASFLAPINELLSLGGTFQDMRGDLERVDDVLDNDTIAPPTVDRLVDENGDQITRLKGYVELRDVTFGYSPLDKPLFENFNLAIAPGERVALVGGSGSGKSTLAKIICGEYEPWSGEVLFDGLPRNQIPSDVLRNSFAVVDQDISLFEGSVRENLTLWDDSVPEAYLRRACQDAAANEFVMALPGGLDGTLLEGGVNLSGGQRQRLEIARSLVLNPAVLVFDEATSALDADTEGVVMERLRMRGCTAILVAHRLSTVRDSDLILVLKDGKVAEQGTHEALWAQDGEYGRLMRADQEPVVAISSEDES